MNNTTTESNLFGEMAAQMLACCHHIRVLLKEDQDDLKKNALKKMAASNDKKLLLLEELYQLTQRFDATRKALQEPNVHSMLIKKLRDEIAECYKYVMTNSHVVFANLNQLKLIHDEMRAQGAKNIGIYDVTGMVK